MNAVGQEQPANHPPTAILIQGGRVIDPANEMDQVADVLLAEGKVRQVAPNLSVSADRVIDAAELIVAPGLIDMHVHLREPGNEDEETIASGARAAVAAGFAAVACMPNTHPPLDNEAAIEFVYRQATRAGAASVYPIGAVTKARAGKELAELGQMVRAGAVAFSDDGDGIQSPEVMIRALQYAKMFNRTILQHCEDGDLSGGCMHAGVVATRLGLPGIPALAEVIMAQRDLLLAEQTGARYHVCHVSTAATVEAIRQAKRRGVRVTAEATPHHLLLTDQACEGYDPNFKVNPPLREQRHVEACLEGLADGTIDCLVSDHAPHGAEEKELEFQAAPFGVIGIDCELALYVNALIEPRILDWPALIAKMTINPARVLGLEKGTLAVGANADVTLIDPTQEWTIDAYQFVSKSRNCPFHGRTVRGRAVATVVGGVIRWEALAGREREPAAFGQAAGRR